MSRCLELIQGARPVRRRMIQTLAFLDGPKDENIDTQIN